jgi:hypothetical protein
MQWKRDRERQTFNQREVEMAKVGALEIRIRLFSNGLLMRV